MSRHIARLFCGHIRLDEAHIHEQVIAAIQ